MKVINRIWLGSKIPYDFAGFGQQWERLNPGYVVKDWDNHEIFSTTWINQEVLDDLRQKSEQPGADLIAYYTHMADVIDYELVYNEGGWYFNTDLKPLKPLSELEQSYKMSVAGMAMEDDIHAVNMAMYAPKPQDRFYAAIIEELPRRYFSMPDEFMNATTGVQLIMSVLPQFPDVQLYHRDVFNPIHWSQFDYGTTPDYESVAYPPETIATHLWGHRTNQRNQRVLEPQ